MIRTLLITCLILSLTFSIKTPTVSANIITVNASCTLIDAIIAANTNSASGNCPAGGTGADTIVLNADVSLTTAYGGSTNIGGGQAGLPDIITNITIQNGTHSIIAGSLTNFRIFNVMGGGSLTLNGVIVRRGKIVGTPHAMGGGIYVNVGGTLALDGARVMNNQAIGLTDPNNPGDALGGGVYNDGTISSIAGSTIRNNLAQGGDSTDDAGGMVKGGGIFNSGNITSIASTTVATNTARSGEGFEPGLDSAGGGIFNEAFIGSITEANIIENQLFAGNCLSISNCDWAMANGGGLANEGSINTLNNISISRNLLEMDAGGIVFGGGLYNNGGITTLSNCTIDENILRINSAESTYTLDGAGLAVIYYIGTIQNCSFSNNLIQSYAINSVGILIGGGMFVSQNDAVSINRTVISGNTVEHIATNVGSGITVDGAGAAIIANGVSMSNSVIAQNHIEMSTTDEIVSLVSGLELLDSNGVTIYNTTISGNTSIATSESVGLLMFSNLDVTLNHLTAINNTSDVGGTTLTFDAMLYDPITVNGSLIGKIEDCVNLTGSNNLTTNAAVVNQCPSVFDSTFTIGTDVYATLKDNGGGTLTHALIDHGGNPAIDGNPGCGLATDQRGFPRDANCDIGAFEAGTLQNGNLIASATCDDSDLAVTIASGDAPFNITASAGINTPVIGAGLGITTINGPEKWDNLTVTENSGNMQSINLGQFKCRTAERPVPLMPVHQSHITDTTPTFSWMGITDANNYRVFIFDDANPATRTVDIRQNSGGPTSLTLNTPLPTIRLFWRVRGRQNRIWSLWSIRFTLFVDPVVFAPSVQSDASPPTIEATPIPQPTIIAPPNDRNSATMPPPPNSR
ncbi:MAG: hypothetical protein L0154_25040 [Chloroflexi bacterium]|nr:hypothetical protein [Chloroflexota bacterium]